MKTFGRSLILAAGLVVSAGANALVAEYQDGDAQNPFVTPANNSLWGGGVVGVNGSHLFNDSADFITVTYEFIYKEAGYNNSFYVDNALVFSTGAGTPTGAPATTQSFQAVVGAFEDLNFSFLTGSGIWVDNVRTSENQNNGNKKANFFVTYLDDAMYIALDDGHPIDNDHDDMIIRITFVPGIAFEVPEPASLALLGLGLLGAGFASRRKS